MYRNIIKQKSDIKQLSFPTMGGVVKHQGWLSVEKETMA